MKWMEQKRRAVQLSIRRPVVDDPPDREIGEHRAVRAGMTGGGSTGREHPVPFPCTDRVHSAELLPLVVFENAQVHVIDPSRPMRANQRPHHLHDFHQLDPPLRGEVGGLVGVGAAGADDEVFGGSGSQWSMMPTMVRSLG